MYKPKRAGGKPQCRVGYIILFYITRYKYSRISSINIYTYYNVRRTWFKGLGVGASNDVSPERCVDHHHLPQGAVVGT